MGSQALRKLAAFQLPRDAAWVLKVIQSAVLADASRIDVRQSRRSIQFRLFEARLGSLEELVEAWTQPGEAMKPAQGDLVVALRTVCFSAGRRAVLVRQDPESGVSAAVWDGEQVSILSETELKRRSIPTAWFSRDCWTLRVFGSDSKKTRVEETHEFSRYAVSCPIPLEVDGRKINHFGVEDVSQQRSSLIFITHPLRSRDLPKRNGIRLAQNADGDQLARLAWVLYQNRARRPSCLSWIRGGLVGTPLTKGASAIAAAGYLIRREIAESKKTARVGKALLERLVEAVEFQLRVFH